MAEAARPSGRRWFVYLAGMLAVELGLAALIPLASPGAGPGALAAKEASLQSGTQSYLPLVTSSVHSPLTATSYYMDTVDSATLYGLGCLLGQRDLGLAGTQDSIVVLDFGKPVEQSGTYGVSLFSFSFASTSQIGAAAQNYIQGYWDCSGNDTTSQLRLALGTSNYGSQVTSQHGAAWAQMVNGVGNWLISTGYATQVKVAGANDMELSWNSPTVTRAWMDGYDSINDWRHYDYGAAEGCPPYGDCGTSSHPEWTSEDVWYLAWGAPPAYSLPEIYLTSGGNAQQWYNLSLYGSLNHGIAMTIDGALTQYQACQQRGCIPAVANTPEQGWTQLWTALHNDSRTAQDLPWSADIKWLDVSAGAPFGVPSAAPSPEAAELRQIQEALAGPVDAPTRNSLEEKAALIANEQEAQAQAQAVGALKPTGAPGALPSAAPEQRPTGIFEDVIGPFSPQEMIVTNAWQDRVNGQWVQVYAGASADDPTQGLVAVLVQPLSASTGSLHATPSRAGAVRITSAHGSLLTLTAEDGSIFVFDASTRQFTGP
jgi:hypothetical protein